MGQTLESAEQEPLFNCHTHVFTADHVPPYLAKKFVPAPFYFAIHLGFIVSLFRCWYKGPANIPYTAWYKRLVKYYGSLITFFNRFLLLRTIAGYYIFLFVFVQLFSLLPTDLKTDNQKLATFLNSIYTLLLPVFPVIHATWLKLVLISLILLFFGWVRNLLFFIAKLLWKGLANIPGRQTKEMLGRYLNIGRYAFHREQKTILSKLKGQYAKDTRFVILPMDMEFMDAGTSPIRYRDQMKALAEIKSMPSNKELLYPFVFADPRRMVDKVENEKRYVPGDKIYYDWDLEGDEMVLKNCFIKEYLEELRFSGIKIYPALGYYPFDARLLALWKYAADHDIPVMTHCIRGTIFYRGNKQPDWDTHPLFEQSMGSLVQDDDEDQNKTGNDMNTEQEQTSTVYEKLAFPELKNIDFQANFTHPMNYLCLLEEELLRKLVESAIEKFPDLKLDRLFGFTDSGTPLKYDLRNLKICMGHFGGDDEWKRYFEKDRYNYSSQLTKYPDTGIRFFKKMNGKPSRGKPEQIWKYTDWYSIICSMMLQYPNVYADISYILHSDREILPLLKQTLQNPGLRTKVLYGTDFFVVRNHKSDKNMLADMQGGLTDMEFNLIARLNPKKYLHNTIPEFPKQKTV